MAADMETFCVQLVMVGGPEGATISAEEYYQYEL